MTTGNVLAKAVYDNLAETADELEFHRGDIVTVIEQNTAGLEGWWLCSLNGRQGIAPGNRLRLIPMMYNPMQQSGVRQTAPLVNDEDEEYDVPKHQYTNQNNNNNDPNDVYDVPTSRNWGSKSELDIDEDEVYDVPPGRPFQTSLLSKSSEKILSSSPHHRTIQIEQEVYDVPSNLITPGNSSNVENNQDPSEVYDVPPFREADQEDVYDVPVSNKVTDSMPLDVSALLEQEEEEDEVYDVPPYRVGNDMVDGLLPVHQTSTPSSKRESPSNLLPDSPDIIYDVPKSQALGHSYIDNSLNLSNISSTPDRRKQRIQKQESEDYVYDVPPQVTRDQPPPSSQFVQDGPDDLDVVIKRLSLVDADGSWHERKSTSSVESISSIIAANAQYTELNIGHSSAIDILIRLKQSLEDSVSNLLTHVYEGWRQKDNISGKIGVIKEVFDQVLAAVAKFVEFARGSMANANAAYERGLSLETPRKLITGMHKLLQPLEEDNMMLQQANDALNQAYWSLSKLVSDDKDIGVPDEIDSFVMTSRAVSDDSRQMAAYIHTHSQYLFKQVESRGNVTQLEAEMANERRVLQKRPLPEPPAQQRQSVVTNSTQNEETWLEDYDYVSLEEQEELSISSNHMIGISTEVQVRHMEVLEVLELSNEQNGLPVIVGLDVNADKNSQNDQFTLQDMVEDVPLLVDGLVSAIKQFYASINRSEPPKTFVSLSKQVILCAHELVFFGDTLYRRLQHQQMQEIVKGHCTQLCTSLKRTVAATKHAAQQWPSNLAVQEMVDRVTDITASAHQFRILLSQCSVR